MRALIFIGIAAAFSAGAALAQAPAGRSPHATKGGWELGAQLARYRYEEPGLM